MRVPPKPEWLGNSYGRKKFVPEPWKPVKAGEKQCEVLMAKYAWDGNSPMPNVTTPGRDIFAKPPQLAFKDKDGKELPAKVLKFALKEHDDEQAVYEIETDLGGKATLNSKVKIEFDGLAWYQIHAAKPSIDLTGASPSFR